MRALEILEKLEATKRELKTNTQSMLDNPQARCYRIRQNQLKDNIHRYTRMLKAYGCKGSVFIISWFLDNTNSYVTYNDLASESEAKALFKIKMPQITNFTVRELQAGRIYNYPITGK